MDDETRSLRIKPFDGTGFNNWCFRMKAYLQQLEVLRCVEVAADEEDFWVIPASDSAEVKAAKEVKRAARIRQDNKCQSVLIQAIADSHLEYIKDKQSPKQIWDGLHDVFERKSITNRFLLKLQLLSMRYQENDRLQDHFLRFDKLVREIKGAGAQMDEEDVICHLMLTMPSSYDAVTTAMEAVSERLTMDLVRRKYLDVEAKRRGQQQDADVNEAAFSGKNKSKFKCFGCGQPGHRKAQCPKSGENKSAFPKQAKKSAVQNANVGTKTVSFVAADGRSDVVAASAVVSSKWYLDSGASEHMSNNKALFDCLEKLETEVVIQTAKSGVNLFARFKGRITARAVVNGCEIEIRIEDVLYIPELSLNLLSLRRLENSGKKVIFFGGRVTVEADNEVVATGRQHGRLYCMDFECVKMRNENTTSSALMTGKVSKQLELWHQRFGHLGNENLQKLVKKGMVEGMKIASVGKKNEMLLCEPCITAKQTREPFKVRSDVKRASRPLEIVHSDVCGKITPVSWDGNEYFVSFTDDYTHISVVYLMKTKDQVLECLMEFEAMASAHFGSKISRLRTDNGGEYCSHAMKQFCRCKGIRMEKTVPYTPEQNGVSERLNRTIEEKARAMLQASGLPKFLWGEAVYTAVYLMNRSPSVAVAGDVTPYEAWNGHKPDVANLRVFGSDCYVHVPKQLRKKLDDKSEKVSFVGYAPNGYRVWNGTKVFIGRDVIFNENELRLCTTVKSSTTICENDEVIVKEQVADADSDPEVSDTEASDTEQEETDSDNYISDDENDDSEEVNPGGPSGDPDNIVRRSGRNVVPPIWHSDFDMNISAFALSAEEFIDNIPADVSELKKRSDWPSWKSAIGEELESLRRNDTWKLVELPAGKKVIDSKWVFKVKRNSEGEVERYKARLVARGFTQRPGFDYTDTYSPVAKMATLRILLALANQKGWHVHQMDVKCAFLNGTLDEEIFMRQPAGFEKGKNLVCRLNKAIYGLKQASRNWNQRFHDFICKLGFKRSEYDFCLYQWSCDGVIVLVVIYVDDILIVSNSEKAISGIKKLFSTEFEMKDFQDVKSFLGLNIQRNKQAGTMTIDQRAYIQSVLERFGMDGCKPSLVPMEPNLKLMKGSKEQTTDKPYRELVGCLMYLMVTSRPDICAAVSYFAGFQCGATEEHWVHLKRVLRYLKGTIDCKLVYRRSESVEMLEAYADADWGNDPNDRRSVSGFVCKLYGSTVTWATKKQSSVALSTTEAELMALCQASCEVVWILNLLNSVEVKVVEPVSVYEDNQSCISVTVEPRKHKRMKHVEIQNFFVRELVEKGRVQLIYLPTEDQLADVMTKGLASPRFRKLRDVLGVMN